MRAYWSAAGFALVLLAGQANAAVVKVEDLALGNGFGIEANSPGFGSSGPVTLDWNPLNNSSYELLKWNGSYSNRDAAYCSPGTDCALDLTVSSGNSVTLDSFFLGVWPNASHNIQWSVVDLLTNLVVGSGNPFVDGQTGHVQTGGWTSTVGFRILFGPDGFNGGINDITYSFNQISTVPVPGAALLFGTALGGLLAFRRRSRASA